MDGGGMGEDIRCAMFEGGGAEVSRIKGEGIN